MPGPRIVSEPVVACESCVPEFTDAQIRHGFPYKMGISLMSHNFGTPEDRRVMNDNLKNIACILEYLCEQVALLQEP